MIPKHNEIRLEALKLLSQEGAMQFRAMEMPLAKVFKLTEEEIERKYESGNGKMFLDRISWALSYLFNSGLVEKPSRGVFKISELGIKMLNTPNEIETFVQKQMRQRYAQRKERQPDEEHNSELKLDDVNPTELMHSTYQNIRKRVYDEILSTILSKKPYEFEKLVVQLLQKMGYGGEVENSGLVTQQSNDGGIDGVIKEDVLGFGRIYIQAKRYALDTKIGRPELSNFVGALAGSQASKGVFITTAQFNENAKRYAQSLPSTTLVLIDGQELAKHIYNYSLGMQTEQVFEIKGLDGDFWDEMLNEDTRGEEVS